MNNGQRHDDTFLKQLDHLLEQGRPHDEAFVNTLADTFPKANRLFQQELELMIMTQLQNQPEIMPAENRLMHTSLVTQRARPVSIASLIWAFTLMLVAVVLVGIMLNRPWSPLIQDTSAALQTDQTMSLVVAAQDIQAGTVINDSMLGVITVSKADMDRIGSEQGGHEFIADRQTIIGQMAASDIHWFQPIETAFLGEPPTFSIPKDYHTIGFPLQADTVQGLNVGDRVDVLATIEGQIRVVAADVLLSDIAPEIVTLATPSWQLGILLWLSQSDEPYALRLYTGKAPEAPDSTPIEFTFTAPEVLPDGFVFDLIVNLPANKGYLLTGLPASIDAIPFTANADGLHFWFKNLDLVNVTHVTEVTIRLPKGDATNLEYLIGLSDTTLTLIPDAATYP